MAGRWRRAAGPSLLAFVVGIGACAIAPVANWNGDCPTEDGPLSLHLVAMELSASERETTIIADRLERLEDHVRQAVDCDAPVEVVILDWGRAVTVYSERFSADANTEVARDHQVLRQAGEAMVEIRHEVLVRLDKDSSPGSDPGAVFRVLHDRLVEFGPEAEIRALILADGVTNTDKLSLNRPLLAEEISALAADVAPDVDLEQRVHLDWPDIGLTADPFGPPGEWLDALVALWTEACESRGAALPCLITSS